MVSRLRDRQGSLLPVLGSGLILKIRLSIRNEDAERRCDGPHCEHRFSIPVGEGKHRR